MIPCDCASCPVLHQNQIESGIGKVSLYFSVRRLEKSHSPVGLVTRNVYQTEVMLSCSVYTFLFCITINMHK